MSFSSAVYEAVRTPHPDEARSAVHSLIGAELRKLDAGVRIEATDYFNHSFVPDFVLSWNQGSGEEQRDLFLRLNVSSSAFGEDLNLLADRAALFIGVFDQHPLDTVAWADTEGAATSLVTQASAVDEFDSELERDSRTIGATREIVRSGMGAIDASSAERIGASYRGALSVIDDLRDQQSDDDAIQRVSEALASIRPVLKETGTIEVEQALHALWIRNGGSPNHFPGQQGWNARDLSPEALRAVLLDLIDSGGVGIDPGTWAELAGHISAEDIGRFLRRPIYDGGFDEMAKSLSPEWTAKRVWVTEQQTASLLPEPFAWLVDDEILGIEAGQVRMFFADDGRHFMGKPNDLALPSLEDVSDFLESSDVQGAALRSVADDVELVLRAGAGNRSVREMVTDLLANPEGTGRRVRSLMVSVPGTDHGARVNFGERKIELDEATSVRTAAQMAFRYFCGGDAASIEAFNAFLLTQPETADGPDEP